MAMPFSPESLKKNWENYWKPAADKAGFSLNPLFIDEKPGLLDERIMVEIRNSVFVVAEVTDLNPNVMWEAGYAQGLGKQVIYTCCEDFWPTVKERGFDINHRYTIFWEEDALHKAGDVLTSVIQLL